MSLSDEQLVETLCRQSEDFNQTFQEHRKYDQQLQVFVNKPYLTPEEELEEAQLKKLKLKAKDKLFRLMAEYAQRA
ncbi:MAG: DUF465 domain-containing protein [Deltaproteobacteria bacterium]|nr:DUF465 domain-containing protein [Candidatus Anaeroferrophillus wilburensis]MBN2888082.1 DUF465 domain-containing protein [Deltaproteobacteria bacterium]